jgi:4-diphosphocytidyl-2-C-methyl-D-erythritol kinase
MTVQAPAKVNLWLEALGKRADGYHEIRTIMQTVSLFDTLRLAPRGDGGICLHADHPELPPPEENLVVRAAVLLHERCGLDQGADIALEKRIPAGAGLGGGSSDCAATLRGLNELWDLNLGEEPLRDMAAELGSDVPFFITGGTALCEGRGEEVSSLPSGGPLHYVLIMPAVSLSTAEVYRRVRSSLTKNKRPTTIDTIKRALATGNAELLGNSLHNALQVPALEVSPEVKRVAGVIESFLPQPGCYGYSLSGSGSAFFAVCAGPDDAQHLASKLKQNDLSAIVVSSTCFE